MKLLTILKFLLLWTTILSVAAFLAGGFESLVEDHLTIYALFWLNLNILLIYMCCCTISYKELYIFSGMSLIDRLKSK